MARRRIQEVLATDPKYSGVFIADAKPSSKVEPAIQPTPPLEDQEAQSTEQALEPESPGREEGPPAEHLKAAEVKPAPVLAPAVAPASVRLAKRGRPSTGQAKAQVSVRLRPLASQIERLTATGLKPKQVMKAALRKTMESFTVAPTYIEHSRDIRAAGSTYTFDTTLTLDAEVLARLAQKHDPLGVEGQYWLMRGQLEPVFWAALDDMLTQLAKSNPA